MFYAVIKIALKRGLRGFIEVYAGHEPVKWTASQES